MEKEHKKYTKRRTSSKVGCFKNWIDESIKTNKKRLKNLTNFDENIKTDEGRFKLYVWMSVFGILLVLLVILVPMWLTSSEYKIQQILFSSTLAIFLFTFPIVSFSWWLKNRDQLKQFRDTQRQYDESLFANAIQLLFKENDILANSVGLKQLIALRHKNYQDKISIQSIDLITSSELKLANAKLRKVDFQKVKLNYANLSGADLQEATLINADLYDADLQGAKLNYANLSSADLREAKLNHAELNKALLISADLREAALTGAKMNHADLNGAKLRKATLSIADLQETKLNYADLNGADLREAKLNHAELNKALLINADLRGANLTGAKMNHADLNGAKLNKLEEQIQRGKYPKPTKFNQTDLRDANLLHTHHLEQAKLTDAIYNDKTDFPDGFKPEDHGMIHENDLEESKD